VQVLICGCGDVGTASGLELAGRGHEVWGLRRRADRLPAPIHPLSGDLATPGGLPDWPVPFDLVLYSAAADRTTEAAYRSAYVDGLKNVVESLAASGQRPARLFFTSSTGVYGQSSGEWVDETSATHPSHFTGQTMLEAEAVCSTAPFPATIVRLAGIYGPGRTRLADGVARGELHCYDSAPHYTNRIHRDDCAGFLAHVAELDHPERIYIGVDDEPTETCTVLHWLAERLAVPSPHRAGEAPATERGQRGGKRARNTRLVASGYRLRFPTFREGYGALIDERGSS